MDTATLVDVQIDLGRRLIEHLKTSQFKFESVFWVKSSEADDWQIFVISDAIDGLGPLHSYRSLYTGLDPQDRLLLQEYSLSIISPSDPIAKDVLDIIAKFGPRFATRSRRAKLGPMAIEEVYLYGDTP